MSRVYAEADAHGYNNKKKGLGERESGCFSMRSETRVHQSWRERARGIQTDRDKERARGRERDERRDPYI